MARGRGNWAGLVGRGDMILTPFQSQRLLLLWLLLRLLLQPLLLGRLEQYGGQGGRDLDVQGLAVASVGGGGWMLFLCGTSQV